MSIWKVFKKKKNVLSFNTINDILFQQQAPQILFCSRRHKLCSQPCGPTSWDILEFAVKKNPCFSTELIWSSGVFLSSMAQIPDPSRPLSRYRKQSGQSIVLQSLLTGITSNLTIGRSMWLQWPSLEFLDDLHT